MGDRPWNTHYPLPLAVSCAAIFPLSMAFFCGLPIVPCRLLFCVLPLPLAVAVLQLLFAADGCFLRAAHCPLPLAVLCASPYRVIFPVSLAAVVSASVTTAARGSDAILKMQLCHEHTCT